MTAPAFTAADRRRVLAFDPSSTCVGWADLRDGVVAAAGREYAPKSWPPGDRLRAIADGLAETFADAFRADRRITAVIEVPGTDLHGRRDPRGLILVGEAAGICRGLAEAYDAPVCRVEAQAWIGGRSKTGRRAAAAAAWAGYRAADDPGFDTADAIELGLWFHRIGHQLGPEVTR